MTQPQQPQQHDRHSAIQQIPPHLHATADALAGQGFDWSQILQIIGVLVQTLGPLLKRPPQTP